ncbi:MAG: ApaG protein [Phenylobacterium sp.]|jgi:ApaG protein
MNPVNPANPVVDICVTTQYIEAQSQPDAQRFIFTYTISITNDSAIPMTLRKRHWLITNSDNSIIEVNGDGVVGDQPLLAPQQSYQYTSGVVLNSPVGTMEGHYLMEKINGETFKAPIPTFLLSVPNSIN